MCHNSCGKCSCTLALITKVLVVVGGLNWGLVGLGMLLGNGSGWNVVNMLLGGFPIFEALVYVLVGVAALMTCFGCKCKTCKSCKCDGGVCVPSNDTTAPEAASEATGGEASSM